MSQETPDRELMPIPDRRDGELLALRSQLIEYATFLLAMKPLRSPIGQILPEDAASTALMWALDHRQGPERRRRWDPKKCPLDVWCRGVVRSLVRAVAHFVESVPSIRTAWPALEPALVQPLLDWVPAVVGRAGPMARPGVMVPLMVDVAERGSGEVVTVAGTLQDRPAFPCCTTPSNSISAPCRRRSASPSTKATRRSGGGSSRPTGRRWAISSRPTGRTVPSGSR